MEIKQIVDFLDNLQQNAESGDSIQEAIHVIAEMYDLAQVCASLEEDNGETTHYTFYQRYDTQMLNAPDFQDQIPYDNAYGFILFQFWKTESGNRCEEEELDIMRMMSRILVMHLSRYKRFLRDQNAVTHDEESGALNTTGYVLEGQKIIDSGVGSKYTAVYLNISKFKLVNQRYGHEVGNLVLASVAKNLREILNRLGDDQLCGRLGGDNFVALVADQYLDDFLSNLYHYDVATAYDGEEIYIRLIFFIGVYQIQKSDRDMSIVMENSSVAFSLAKHKNSLDPVYYDEELHRRILREKEIEGKMRDALENEEFLVYYQPKIDLRTYRINGAEALVRWMDDGKLIPPVEFVPLFERNGFICNIDFYVLNRVCKSIRQWLDSGIDMIPVSVNFSKVHFTNSRFTEQIVATIKKFHIPTKYIEIEFTETVDFQDKEALVHAVEYLKSFGIATSMDDFGTGFSSLSLLKTLPVDVLKIDKSLLDTQTASEKERVIISNVVRMVQEMNIRVITEGVETQEQAEFLKGIHCDNAQGFLFDKPLPKEQFEKRLVKGYYDGEELKDVE